jgi:LPXTG-motif cell wall-anchored protein
MDWLPIALAGVAALGAAMFVLRRRRRTTAPEGSPPDPDEAIMRTRQQTALSELRDMREALGPAAHNRVERRRNPPPPGVAPKVERRKKTVRPNP